MNALNPYASHLAGADPLEVITATPGRLATFVRTLGSERLERKPAPGKWNAREIICHLADCEVVFAFRLRQALAQDHHMIQPFDQDKWAAAYAAYDAPAALAVFSALRRWNISFIHAAPAEASSKRVTHPERGQMTFKTVVETMGGHDLNHVKQLEAIAAGTETPD
jgi:hypothetical protein